MFKTVNPCPSGWRLPTQAEYQALHNTSTTWAVAHSVRGNAVAGRFYGPNSGYCSLPDNMSGCIFLPACGYRNTTSGVLNSRGTDGFYWSSMYGDEIRGFLLSINTSNPNGSANKANGCLIRCVQ